MSGIYIPGMEMPTSCRDCWIEQEGFWCGALDGYQNTRCFTNERREDCPLVPVPPHGRLIDGDALKDAIDSTDWYHQAPSKDMVLGANSAEHQAWYKWQDINAAVYNAPTIIPADKEGEG